IESERNDVLPSEIVGPGTVNAVADGRIAELGQVADPFKTSEDRGDLVEGRTIRTVHGDTGVDFRRCGGVAHTSDHITIGFVHHAQAALLLDVSTKRVGELVRLGKLTDFIFLGRKYVSMKEVDERSKQELKAGRPRRGIGKLATASLKAAVKTDSVQASPGGYAGSYFKKQREEANERRRREFQKKWRAVIEARRNERKS